METAAWNRCVLFSWLLLATVGIACGRIPVAAHAITRDLVAEDDMAEAHIWTPPDHPSMTPISSPDASSIEQRHITGSIQGDSQSAQERIAHSPVATVGPDVAPTMMRCLGTTTTTRACHFQDLYYDIGSGHFVYYGPAGSTPNLFGVAPAPNEPWLRLIRYV